MDRRLLRHLATSLACGVIVGSALDALHTHSGTTVYDEVWWAGMAWWTPLVFGATGMIALGTYPLVEARLGAELAPRVAPQRLWLGVASFVALYAASGFLPLGNGAKLAIIAGAAVALGASCARSRGAMVIAAIAAVAGSAVEAGLILAGTFRYTDPDIAGIPMWLPALYAAGAFSLGPMGAHMWSGSPLRETA